MKGLLTFFYVDTPLTNIKCMCQIKCCNYNLIEILIKGDTSECIAAVDKVFSQLVETE